MENELLTLLKDKLESQRERKLWEEYQLLKTNEERVKFSMNIFHEVEMTPKLKASIKDSKVSVDLRNQANKLYTSPKESHQLDKIIELYTKSVAYAPNDSQELSIAFANRSAASFKGRLYDESLKDIKRALDLDYPNNLRAKLFARKVQCLVVLSAPAAEVEEALQKARKWLEEMDKNSRGRKLVEEVLNNSLNKSVFPEQRVLLDDERNLSAILNQHPEVRGLSSAVEIKYSKEFGRHVVATRDIDPGEVIAIQQSYASVLNIEKLFTNCSNCLKQTWSGIPCNFCIDVIYCSEKCREEAWKDHHDSECQLLRSIKAYEFQGSLFFSLRLCVKAIKETGSIEKLQKELEFIDSRRDPKTNEFTENIFDPSRYESVYSLATNAEKRCSADLFRSSSSAAYILFILATKSINNIFGKQLPVDFQVLAQDLSVIFLGGLIMRHLNIIGTNAYTISEGFSDQNLERGGALVPSMSFFNHSCHPTCCRSFYGRTMIQTVILSVKKGSEIFDTYNVYFATNIKSYRQYQLKILHFFDCQCVACDKSWPTTAKLPSIHSKNLPDTIKQVASTKATNLFLLSETIFKGDIADRKEIIENLIEIIKYFDRNIPAPFQELCKAYLTLRQSFILQGNCMQTLN